MIARSNILKEACTEICKYKYRKYRHVLTIKDEDDFYIRGERYYELFAFDIQDDLFLVFLQIIFNIRCVREELLQSIEANHGYKHRPIPFGIIIQQFFIEWLNESKRLTREKALQILNDYIDISQARLFIDFDGKVNEEKLLRNFKNEFCISMDGFEDILCETVKLEIGGKVQTRHSQAFEVLDIKNALNYSDLDAYLRRQWGNYLKTNPFGKYDRITQCMPGIVTLFFSDVRQVYKVLYAPRDNFCLHGIISADGKYESLASYECIDKFLKKVEKILSKQNCESVILILEYYRDIIEEQESN